MSFYVVLKSNSCLDTRPNNVANNFINEFDVPILLIGNWTVALIEYTFSEKVLSETDLVITSNIVKPTVVGGSAINLLREIWCGDEDDDGDRNGILHDSIDPLMYIPVSNANINKIHISIKDETGRIIDFEKKLQVTLILHFLKEINGD